MLRTPISTDWSPWQRPWHRANTQRQQRRLHGGTRVDADTQLQRALWILAERLAVLKGELERPSMGPPLGPPDHHQYCVRHPEMIMHTIPRSAAAGTRTFPQAFAQGTALARTTLLSTLHDHLDHVLALVETGHVWREDESRHAAV